MRVEDDGLSFGLGALGWEFFAVPEETHAGRISNADDEFTGGVKRGVGWGDKSFLCDELSVGCDRDPCVFCGTNHEGQVIRGRYRRLRSRRTEGSDGDVTLFFNGDLIRTGSGRRCWRGRAGCGFIRGGGWRR